MHTSSRTGWLAWRDAHNMKKPRGKFAATAYRPSIGSGDLFSVWVSVEDAQALGWRKRANVAAFAAEMAARLPAPGAELVITDGFTPIADFVCDAVGA